MDEIESQIQLPLGAYKLDNYARYYALDDRRIVAIYTTLSPKTGSDHIIPIGERGWVEDRTSLPYVLDGGCSIVNVVYSLDDQSFDQISCNGEA